MHLRTVGIILSFYYGGAPHGIQRAIFKIYISFIKTTQVKNDINKNEKKNYFNRLSLRGWIYHYINVNIRYYFRTILFANISYYGMEWLVNSP